MPGLVHKRASQLTTKKLISDSPEALTHLYYVVISCTCLMTCLLIDNESSEKGSHNVHHRDGSQLMCEEGTKQDMEGRKQQ